MNGGDETPPCSRWRESSRTAADTRSSSYVLRTCGRRTLVGRRYKHVVDGDITGDARSRPVGHRRLDEDLKLASSVVRKRQVTLHPQPLLALLSCRNARRTCTDTQTFCRQKLSCSDLADMPTALQVARVSEQAKRSCYANLRQSI